LKGPERVYVFVEAFEGHLYFIFGQFPRFLQSILDWWIKSRARVALDTVWGKATALPSE
jgi:hypothetical protein